jgi:hypothetical protein
MTLVEHELAVLPLLEAVAYANEPNPDYVADIRAKLGRENHKHGVSSVTVSRDGNRDAISFAGLRSNLEESARVIVSYRRPFGLPSVVGPRDEPSVPGPTA